MQGTITLTEMYAASLDQTALRVFWAATAINNVVTIGADAANACAEASPPVAPLYVYVDENTENGTESDILLLNQFPIVMCATNYS